MRATDDAPAQQPCALQDADVLGGGGKGHPEGRGQLAQGLLPVAEPAEDRPAGRMGQGGKRGPGLGNDLEPFGLI
jgi:hypothetical protein